MNAEGIVKLAQAMGVERIQARTTYVLMSCPFAKWEHQSGTDRHPSLSVVIAPRSHWRCFSCGMRGSMYGLASQWAGKAGVNPEPLLGIIDADENSVAAVTASLDKKFDEKWKREDEAAADRIDFTVFEERELEPFIGSVPQYVLDRGIALETCKQWQLGYDKNWVDPDTGEVRQRVVFPIRRRDRKLVGMVGRAIDDIREKRYYNYWHFPRNNYLYGMHEIDRKFHDFVVVVEGMFDVLKLWEYRIPVVGLMGKDASEEQIKALLEFPQVYVMLDWDDAGKKGMEVLIRRLLNRVMVFVPTLPPGKTDPKQMTIEEAWAVVENAKRVL